tara:strand:- start:2840 stop:3247 length:408 start_codon:yes stop_codon:yes gene_type:complete
MGTFVMTDASVTINSVDLSDHVRSLTFTYEGEAIDDTNMSDVNRVMTGGLINYGVDVEFSQDYAASKVDATLFALVGQTTVVSLKPTSAAVSATNPSYTMTMLLTTYNPISGSVGDLATASVTFAPSGAVVRATS